MTKGWTDKHETRLKFILEELGYARAMVEHLRDDNEMGTGSFADFCDLLSDHLDNVLANVEKLVYINGDD